jgi:hypothetical protein
MAAVMGDVFSMEYNCHVPLCFKGQVVPTCGWLYATMFEKKSPITATIAI